MKTETVVNMYTFILKNKNKNKTKTIKKQTKNEKKAWKEIQE